MPKRKNTRNASGSGSIRQRPDGTWEGRYSTGTNPGTGKPIRKSVYAETQREAVKKLDAIKTGIADGTFTEPSKLTVSQWLDIWTAEYLGGVKPRTVGTYSMVCRLYLKPGLGAVRLSALSAHMIQTMYNGLHKGTSGKPGLSAKTVKNIHGVLHKALQQTVKLGYLRFNPADAIELPRAVKAQIQPLCDEKIVEFIKTIQGHKWEVVFRVTLFCGLRQGEVLGLTWGCIDFERGTILIDRQLQRNHTDNKGKYEFISPKNDKSRRISPAPSVMAALREQRRRQAEEQIKAGSAWEDTGLVFTNPLGQNLSVQSVYKEFKRLVAQIGVPETRFHDLRHTYAVTALQSGDDIKTVQETLGHHTASFTLDVYGHVSERMKQNSAARMEAFIQSVEKGG
ncbi:MAG: site-specific integrase [Oscillospiraceae bacterium]|nr:site-specific integrase [Oscillospiraceae bacterium]